MATDSQARSAAAFAILLSALAALHNHRAEQARRKRGRR